MKISQGVITCCLLASLTLSCESVHPHQQLNSINDLKKIDFGQSVPKHSLVLLYWFANAININQYNSMTMTFDPNTDFGSHHFGNFEDLLDRPPWGYRYYTVGNLNEGMSPGYVLQPPNRDYDGSNLDRIIFSAERQTSGAYRINGVYLTQHIPSSNDYDPQHTYQISTSLLQQIREFSNGNPILLRGLRNRYQSDISDFQMSALRNTWGEHLAGLALLLFIVIQEKYSRSSNIRNYTRSGMPSRGAQPAYRHGSGSSYSDKLRQPNYVPRQPNYVPRQPNYVPSYTYTRDEGMANSDTDCLVVILLIAVIILFVMFIKWCLVP